VLDISFKLNVYSTVRFRVLTAILKALRFARIASLHHFCSFCPLGKSDIESLDVDLWRPQIGLEVIVAAKEW